MPVSDLARDDVVTVDPSTPVTEIASTMARADVGSVLVTSSGQPVGIVTDRDLTVRVLPDAGDPTSLTAEDVMSDDLHVVDDNAGFFEAAETMSDHGVRRLPVIDGDGDLAGIITIDDLTELLADEEQHVAEVLRAQRPPY
ncbi:CBS domain-containing protein [Halobacterium rubrum]|uniref:CBS domain-containing protein n=1 Tax=Halobacterium TaxID=2239 RepID=UPI001F32DCAF|nr:MULTISPECIES: CBS domain-containing protein [Halobacterium]MDH5021480.1 CBS domain-containing protein [Halobacterium rubrum]